ncbi:MAG: response regulator [Coriobacteriia bacterium]|nr:response regulator [Coriobacteriia bacterium]
MPLTFDGEEPDLLLVDDVPANVRILADMLKTEGYRTRSALSGEAALKAAELKVPDLVLLDIMMPGMNGIEVCRRMKANRAFAQTPVIFLSALDGTDHKVDAFAAGGVDYITKPFQVDEVLARVRTHLRLRQLQTEVEEYTHRLEDIVMEQVREIANAQMATILALARLAESRDDETGTHLERVQAFCRLLGEGYRRRNEEPGVTRSFVDSLVEASTLHDIGKVAISDDILLKPGKLNVLEFEVMKEHTTVGARTLEAVRDRYPGNRFIEVGIEITRSHHERWDGTGYPDGLGADAIPLSARIMAIADVYDALRSKRVYKDAFAHDDSARIILDGAGTHFDPALVEVFASTADQFAEISACW